jgi:uncharacterized protein
MFFYDPLYMVVMLVGMALVFLPQMWLKNVYGKYNEAPSSRGMTGAEVAEAILRENRILDVQVEPTSGFLSDHYDPTSKKIRLSEDHYYGRSIAGVAVAAHEVGHAIQHAQGFAPVVLRSSLVPVVNLGSQLGPILLMVALGIGFTSHIMPSWAWNLAWVGVLLYGSTVLFHTVTLPVEIDASSRATKILAGSRYLTTQEMDGAKKVLTAAAFTYVATALYALIQLMYYVFTIINSRRED